MRADERKAPTTAMHHKYALAGNLILQVRSSEVGALRYSLASKDGTPYAMSNLQVGVFPDRGRVTLPQTIYDERTHGLLGAAIDSALNSGVKPIEEILFMLDAPEDE